MPPVLLPAPGALRRFVRLCRLLLLTTAAVLAVGNLGIAGAWLTAQAAAAPSQHVVGVDNFRVVDERVLRGDAPSPAGYRALAELGVTTVVDLRAERDLDVPTDLLAEVGIVRVHLPIRDGQTPSEVDVSTFLDVVRNADGLVYVHCGAGVGRTGAMTAAYVVASGQASGADALADNIAVGPPSLEQIVYAASLVGGEAPDQPPAVIEAISRFLDAPRRIWASLQH